MTYEQWCDAIEHAAEVMPDDPFVFVGALQMLGDLVVKNDATMTDEQKAEMIGVGALLYREMMRAARERKPMSKAMAAMMAADTMQ